MASKSLHVWVLCVVFVFAVAFWTKVHGKGLREEFTWSRISYAKPGEDVCAQGIQVAKGKVENSVKSDDYIFENNIPMGVNRWRDKLFVTVPRRAPGIPSTLNYIPINCTKRHNVPLIPYPSHKINSLKVSPGDEQIVSVYRIAVDSCSRLWMADTGTVHTLGKPTSVRMHRIIIIDLNTDKIIKKYTFKESDLTPKTVLTMAVVDVNPNKCGEAFAYFPDLEGFGLVVYGLKDDDSWRVQHNYFHLEPLAGNFKLAGLEFQWDDGVFSGALTNVKPDGFRDFIFHSMAGFNLYSVSTKVLRTKALATRSYHGDDFKWLGNKGSMSETSASDLHKKTGVLFLSFVHRSAVGCWNTNKPFNHENIGVVQKDRGKMIYPSDLKVSKDDVIVLTNAMPVFIYSKLNYDTVNFRVWMNNVYDAINGTVCA